MKCASDPLDPALAEELARIRSEVASQLEDVTQFWARRSIDSVYGGYLTNVDRAGERLETPEKYLVTQARLVWFYARLARWYDGDPFFLDSAAHGARFLYEYFWDNAYGGWRWSTDRQGRPLDDAKSVYGQAFVLHALSEYALVSGDGEARRFAEQTFESLMTAGADHVYGGFFETLTRSWEPIGSVKTLGTHLALMEAFSGFARLTGDPVHCRRVEELVELITQRMVNPVSGAGCLRRSRDFEPLAVRSSARRRDAESVPSGATSYGLNLQLAWLLGVANEALPTPVPDDLRVRLGRHALKYGVDTTYGGVYREGPHRSGAGDTDKEWWVQAESMVGLLDLYLLSGDRDFLDAFVGVWDFSRAHLTDAASGEWITRAGRDGWPLDTDLGSPSKVAYHSARAAIEIGERIDLIRTGGRSR